MISNMTRNFRNALLICFHTALLGRLNAGNIHIISSGETLYSLSVRYGVRVEDLLVENGIDDPSALTIGTRLVIPDSENRKPLTRSTQKYYQVVKGDTYYGIAMKHGLSVEELLRLNRRLENQFLGVGDSLNVGESSIQPVYVKSVSFENSDGITQVDSVPWWPVAGMKKPLEGKLDGVSIRADPMSYVHVVAEGRVVWTGPYRGFGNVVLVDSGEYIYLYGGNDDLFVNVGQTVNKGNRIGRLGNTGPAGGKQDMFFSVFRNGVPVVPENAPRG